MTDTRALEHTLGNNLAWNHARINFLARFLIALIQVRNVNLMEIATGFGGKATTDSSYRRIKRFFQLFDIPAGSFAILIVQLLALQSPWVLSLDRTNWQLGKQHLNLLVLGIVHQGVAFPLLWVALDKKGNSNTDERIALLQEFINLFGVESIHYLCADREFIGKRWFQWLAKMKIDYRIRIRNNSQITNSRGELVEAKKLFSHFPLNQGLSVVDMRKMWGLSIYVSGMRLEKEQYVIVVSPVYSQEALVEYGKRWGIESLFGCLKSRGFRLEETHMTEGEKLKKLIGLLGIAFSWCHKVGQWLNEEKPLKVKKHGRLAKSIFRLGLDYVRAILLNLTEKSKQVAWAQVILILSRT